MEFDELLSQVLALLQREGRVSYRAIKVRFQLDDDHLEAVKDELIYAKKLAEDEDDRVLVWVKVADRVTEPEREPLSYTPPHLAEKILTSKSSLEGERKQVTLQMSHGIEDFVADFCQ